jgi:2-polyprenyl-6-methoxyphenol hydroxylase-like FAD-dependent oxidoreductase
MEEKIVRTDLLIVGAGPAGASLACFLASYGLTGIMIASAPGTAETPRAHIANMAALECLRDIDLETECVKAASDNDNMKHTRWCKSMAGEEYARIYSWGNDPERRGDYDAASPCKHVDLPQTLLEPILTKRAIHAKWTLRFNTSFTRFTRPSPGIIISEVRDELLRITYKIQSKYLFACDGARSQIVRQLQIPLIRKPGQGVALNILVKADMSQLMKTRTGNLHWVFDPAKVYPEWGWACILRMVKPWYEWMFIILPAPGADPSIDGWESRKDEYMVKIKEWIGDDSIPAEILNVSKWTINEIVAKHYSNGNIHCLGDAVHRHPPFNGLGSNTCIQDAFNLAWKIAYVEQGKAGSELLQSYSAERQPVGVSVITRANQGLRDHQSWIETIGMSEPDVEVRKKILAEFEDPGPKGRARREAFRMGIANTATEFHGLGVEMNQRYASRAVYLTDETGPVPLPSEENEVKQHVITTYPGSRLPHAWLNTRVPGKPLSTIDLAGHGQFTLITGPTGQASWSDAAAQVSKKIGVDIKCYSIGWKQDYEDVYHDWARRREVEEDGCVLSRPDRFVAWRSIGMLENCGEKLLKVMTSLLSIHADNA